MLLAIDAGNSNITIGVFDSDILVATIRLDTKDLAAIANFGADERLRSYPIDGIAISSVVPSVTPLLIECARRSYNIDPLAINYKSELGLDILCDAPEAVGVDRLVDAVAAIAKYGPGPLIVIDFGTATVFNAVGYPNKFSGAILPGWGCPGARFGSAEQLSDLPRLLPPHAIGANTRHALQSGMAYGLESLIEGMVARFRAELGVADCPVIATGGQSADVLAPIPGCVTVIDPDLTLNGIRIVWERHFAGRG